MLNIRGLENSMKTQEYKHLPHDSLLIIETQRDKRHFINNISKTKQTRIVSFLNAHALNISLKDKEFRHNLLKADYVLRDGIGIQILLQILGRQYGLNMNGTDLTPEIIKAFAGKRVALLGTKNPWLEKARERVEELGAKVVVCKDGFQDTENYCKILNQKPVDLVVLAMGMPKQEAIAEYLKHNLPYPVVLVNAGAILDFMAERFPRAPKVWRRLHMEWLYRLLKEPRRLAGRYILGGFSFALLAARLWYQERKNINQSIPESSK
jgi:exopolysaccharide biosynthesis WecB/TagA/CpsF family protein